MTLIAYASARPLYTDDAWWHLAYGEAFLTKGPWLDGDPLLFAAAGPASPASWLFDIALALCWRTFGFSGLRVLHATAVLAAMALVYWLFRRLSVSREGAACGTAAFAVLSAYRLFQLRPELFTISATLVLFGVLVAPRSERTTRSLVFGAVVLGMLWANLHAGFLLAPILLAAAAIGVGGARLLEGAEGPLASWRRARRLALASFATLLGSLFNPKGWKALLPYFESGDSTPTLAVVHDEWAPLGLLHLPSPESIPNLLDWSISWVLICATAATFVVWLLGGRGRIETLGRLDPALLALSAAACIAIMTAVRFQWLAVFPLLLVAQISRLRSSQATTPTTTTTRTWAAALVAVLLVPAFLLAGSWSLIARGLPTSSAGYRAPYAIGKHAGHAAWFLKDAGVRGNLFAPYPSGGFLGFWLAPALPVLANGSLNIQPEAMQAYLRIQERSGVAPQSFEDTLEAQEIDVFLGSNLPGYRPNRPRPYTTTHLERAKGWVLVFRNLRSAVWLRDHPGNDENFRRVQTYYAAEGVPFRRSAGFEVENVTRSAPQWAVRHGLIPTDLPNLVRAAASNQVDLENQALTRLAGIRASLGQYAESLALDARLLAWRPDDRGALQRRLWCLLHLDRPVDAVEVALRLDSLPGTDGLGALLASSARRYATEQDPAERAALVARLPLFTRDQASRLTRGYVAAPLPVSRNGTDSVR